MDKSRRSFIKVSALSASGIAFTTTALGSMNSDVLPGDFNSVKLQQKLTRSATYCEVCFWKCAAWVHTDQDDNIQK